MAGEITTVLKSSKQSNSKTKNKIYFEQALNENLMRCLDFIGILSDSTEGQFVKLGSIVDAFPEIIFANMYTDNIFLKQIIYSVLGDLVTYLHPKLFEQ